MGMFNIERYADKECESSPEWGGGEPICAGNVQWNNEMHIRTVCQTSLEATRRPHRPNVAAGDQPPALCSPHGLPEEDADPGL